jgi:hypothetical protein
MLVSFKVPDTAAAQKTLVDADFLYAIAIILGIFASVIYWKAMGLMPN